MNEGAADVKNVCAVVNGKLQDVAQPSDSAEVDCGDQDETGSIHWVELRISFPHTYNREMALLVPPHLLRGLARGHPCNV